MNTPKVINKVTPTHTFDWYIKWIATVFILAGLVCRATDWHTPLDIMLTFKGTVGWFIVAWLWHDRALMILNAIAAVLLLVTLLNQASV